MDSDPLPTATSPCPTDNAEVLSQEALGRGETALVAPQSDLLDSGSRGSKAPDGSEFVPQPNTAPEPPVVPEKVKLIRDRLKTAQSRQKSYYDQKHHGVSFEPGEFVYLRVSPIGDCNDSRLKES